MLKKGLIILYIFVTFIFMFSDIFAAEREDNNDFYDIYNETRIDDIISKYSDREMTENIKNIFNENIEIKNNNILSFSPVNIVKYIFNNIKDEIKKPMKLMIGVIGIVIVSAVVEALKVCFNNSSLNEVISSVCIISIFVSVGYSIIECVKYGVNIINNMSSFMKSFIPIYTGVMSSCGMSAVGSVYNTFLFFVCQIFSEVLSNKLLPVLGVYMAFCLVGPLSQNLNVSKAAKEIKNIITWVLSFVIAILVGFITVQGVVASSVDTVGTRAAKFMIGSTVPVIGNIISDAYTSVKGCFNFVRTGVGAIMIIFVAISLLPIIIKLTLWIFTTKISSGLADFVGASQVSEILKSSGYVISLLFAIIISYMLLIIISTTIVLILGMGLS